MTVAQQVDSGAIAGSAQAPAAVKASWWEHAALYRYGFVVVLLIVWEMVAPFIHPPDRLGNRRTLYQPDLFHLAEQDRDRLL